MIRFWMDRTMVVGITQRNVDKLTAGEPLRIEIVPPTNPSGIHRTEKVVVMFGADKPAILQQLRAAGMQIPHALEQSAQEDPL